MASPVKIPNRDVVNYQRPGPLPEYTAEILFENVGGTELINMVRHDTVSGLNVAYSIISNLTKINLKFDPSLALSGTGVYDNIFGKYKIKFETKIPDTDYSGLTATSTTFLENINKIDSDLASNMYIDANGDLIIELDNIENNEVLEIQVMSNGTIYLVREEV